jgi:hypothetical protein
LRLHDIVNIPVEILKDIKILELINCSIVEGISFTINAKVLSLEGVNSSIDFSHCLIPSVSRLFLRYMDTGHLAELSNYPKLRLITIIHCHLEDPTDRINCQYIETVYFENFHTEKADLSQSKEIHLFGSQVQPIISESWLNVEILEINTGRQIAIPPFERLSVLRLQASCLTEFTTANFPSLRELVLTGCYRMKTIVLVGDLLTKFYISAYYPKKYDLELIDAMLCPSLKEFSVINFQKSVKCLMSYIVPKITVARQVWISVMDPRLFSLSNAKSTHPQNRSGVDQ